MMKKFLATLVIVTSIIGLAGLAAAAQNQGTAPKNTNMGMGPGNKDNQRGPDDNNRMYVGTITEVDSDSLVIDFKHATTTSSLTINLSDDVEYLHGSAADLKVGALIGVKGEKESDGSITAEDIIVNPAQMNATDTPRLGNGQPNRGAATGTPMKFKNGTTTEERFGGPASNTDRASSSNGLLGGMVNFFKNMFHFGK